MLMLSKALESKYTVIKTSFEGIGDDMFDSEERFCREVFHVFARSVRFTDSLLYESFKGLAGSTGNFNELSEAITTLVVKSDKEMVLIIDEVDKSSANRIFMQFLGVLRNLKPILNGRGFSFLEAQTRENRRMDVVITFGAEKFVVELKIWNGRKYEEKGLEQLIDYLEIQNINTGYMVVFNFNADKKYSSQWIEVKGKKVFEIVV